jgi:hypothetical protein
MRKTLSALADPFEPRDVEWRAQSTGKKADGTPWIRVLAYIDNRAIMDRLDDVCGPENWRNEYVTGPGGGVLCGISIRTEGGDWVTKWDGAENTDIEGVKGGLSGAMKRAGYQWGIGRYLYNLEEGFGIVSANGKHYVAAKADKHGGAFKWDDPKLPVWALPGGSGKPGVVSPAQNTRGEQARAVLATAKASVGVKAAAANNVSAADVKLPGTKAHLDGHGGKRVGDVPTAALEVAMQSLKTMDRPDRYTHVVEAIGEVLADRAEAVV